MSKRLPAVSARGVARALERAGFVTVRASGSHRRLVHRSDPTPKVTIPIHTGDLRPGTLRAIIAQARLSIDEFTALL